MIASSFVRSWPHPGSAKSAVIRAADYVHVPDRPMTSGDHYAQAARSKMGKSRRLRQVLPQPISRHGVSHFECNR